MPVRQSFVPVPMVPAEKRLLLDLATAYGAGLSRGSNEQATAALVRRYVQEGMARDLGIAAPRADCCALAAGVPGNQSIERRWPGRDGVPAPEIEAQVAERVARGSGNVRRIGRLVRRIDEARRLAIREAAAASGTAGGGK